MYIEFFLPQGAGGTAASYIYQLLKKEVEDWSAKYNIRYTEKVIKYTYRVSFDDDQSYTYFQLTWPENNWQQYRIIEDLNNKVSPIR
jgi:hypothetical protein